VEIKKLPCNPVRGFIGLAGIIMLGFGAFGLWGLNACLLTIGLVLCIAVSLDETVERCTRLTRG
jgi:hypothetical protein